MPSIPSTFTLALAGSLLASAASSAQSPSADSVRRAATSWNRTHRQQIFRELTTFLAIPNLASDSVSIRRNADTLIAMLSRRGVKAQRLESPGSPPAVYGELLVPGAKRTVVFYAHYDGQPVRPAEWRTAPWEPTLFDGSTKRDALPDTGAGEWRLHARSASDDKSPIIAMLSALDALKAAAISPSVNVKFFFEGEEEAGSGHLGAMLRAHKSLLGADLWLFADGPVHQSRKQQVLFGVRGVMGAELTAYGPARALHSGHYGNWAPNPAAEIANLLSSMRDSKGNIRIAGFMDDVKAPTAAERAAIASVPPVETALKKDLLLNEAEGGDGPILERIMRPSLNIRGISAGGVGSTASNAIPVDAKASIDFRLVPSQTPARVRTLVEAHARAQGFYVVNREPTAGERLSHPRVLQIQWDDGYPAVRTPIDSPAAKALLAVVDQSLGERAVRVPTMGGSLPMYIFDEVLHAPLIVLPIVNHDNNQHAANENLRMQNLWDGIELLTGIMARLDW